MTIRKPKEKPLSSKRRENQLDTLIDRTRKAIEEHENATAAAARPNMGAAAAETAKEACAAALATRTGLFEEIRDYPPVNLGELAAKCRFLMHHYDSESNAELRALLVAITADVGFIAESQPSATESPPPREPVPMLDLMTRRLTEVLDVISGSTPLPLDEEQMTTFEAESDALIKCLMCAPSGTLPQAAVQLAVATEKADRLCHLLFERLIMGDKLEPDRLLIERLNDLVRVIWSAALSLRRAGHLPASIGRAYLDTHPTPFYESSGRTPADVLRPAADKP